MSKQQLTVTAECDEKDDDERVRTDIPVVDYYSSQGVWVRCATCDGIHYARAENA